MRLCRLTERRSPGAVSGPDRERFLPLTGRVPAVGSRAMTIKTLAAVMKGTFAIAWCCSWQKITTPGDLGSGEVGFFRRQQHRRLGSWNRRYWFLGTYPGGGPPESRCLSKQFGLLVEPKLVEKVEPKLRRGRAHQRHRMTSRSASTGGLTTASASSSTWRAPRISRSRWRPTMLRKRWPKDGVIGRQLVDS